MADLTGDGVILQIDGAVATIAFDQPRRRNAMQLRTWLALPSLVAAAEAEAAVGLIVVRGMGGHFGAGNDISEFAALKGDPAASTAFGAAMADAMQAIEAAAKPVVMAIEGSCYGASVALALAGDLRVCASDAMFAITPAKLGALYLRSDLHRLAATIGVGWSKRLIYTARAIGADKALDIGLVDEVLAADQFETQLQRLTATLLEGSPFTLRRTKAMLREVGHGDAPTETAESLAAFVEAIQGQDFNEGTEAFMAKRPPRFR